MTGTISAAALSQCVAPSCMGGIANRLGTIAATVPQGAAPSVLGALTNATNIVSAASLQSTATLLFGGIAGRLGSFGIWHNAVDSVNKHLTACTRVFDDMRFKGIDEYNRRIAYAPRNRVERRNRRVFLRLLKNLMLKEMPKDEKAETMACNEARRGLYLWLRQRLGVLVNRDERRHGIDQRDEQQRFRDNAARQRLYLYCGKNIPQNTIAQLIASATLDPRAPQHHPESGQLLKTGRMSGCILG